MLVLLRSSLFAVLLYSFLFIQSMPVFAATGCVMEVKKASDSSFSTAGTITTTSAQEPITIRVTGAIMGDAIVNSPDNSAFYINVSEGPNTGKRYYIPAESFRNGAFTITIGTDSWGRDLFTKGAIHEIQLVRDWGPVVSHEEICNAGAKVFVRNPNGTNVACNWIHTPDANDGEAYTLRIDASQEIGNVTVSTQCVGSNCGSGPFGGAFSRAETVSGVIAKKNARTCSGQGVCFEAGQIGGFVYYGGLRTNEIVDSLISSIRTSCGIELAKGFPGVVSTIQNGQAFFTISGEVEGTTDNPAGCVQQVIQNPPVYRATVTAQGEGTLCVADLALSFVNALRKKSGEDPDANVLDTAAVTATGQTQNQARESIKIDRFSFCKQVPESQRSKCEECVVTEPGDSEKLYTAIGCIETSEKGLAENLVGLMLGIAGGIALLSILAAAFYLTTSQGDSGKVKEAKDLITAAVSGLFFIVFSIFILQFVGVSILRIPGLG